MFDFSWLGWDVWNGAGALFGFLECLFTFILGILAVKEYCRNRWYYVKIIKIKQNSYTEKADEKGNWTDLKSIFQLDCENIGKPIKNPQICIVLKGEKLKNYRMYLKQFDPFSKEEFDVKQNIQIWERGTKAFFKIEKPYYNDRDRGVCEILKDLLNNKDKSVVAEIYSQGYSIANLKIKRFYIDGLLRAAIDFYNHFRKEIL